MPNENVLTAADRATIMDACQSISRSAYALRDCHTVDGDWGDDLDAKACYDAELQLLERLTALLSHPGQPEPRAEVTWEEVNRLREIARLIGSIFVHGNFKAETHNERELEKLLREQGCFFETLADYDAARAGEAS
jgi:hypothetical protein